MTKLRSLAFAAFLALPLASFAEVDFSVNIAPPVLPVIEQPPAPVEGYIWTPGYWGWGAGNYYWVPGAWVAPPTVGLLWTPPWWGWNNGAYVFNQGYWGPTVGFYGGINYGHGYWGNDYWGGRWEGNAFRYNTAITRVNTTVIHNTYVDRTVVNKEVNRSHTSFNGPNGVKAEANAEQKAAAENAKKMPPTSQQLARQEAAAKDPNLHASKNHGHPSNEAIKSFDQSHEQGKGAESIGTRPSVPIGRTAAGAGAGKAENKAGNVSAEHHAQGAGMNGQEHGNKHATENHGNAHEGENLHGNNQNVEGNHAHSNKMVEHRGAAHGNAMNQQMARNAQMDGRNPQMKSGHPQMGGQPYPKMQGGGNRPHPDGQQQQRKKKPEGS